MMCPADTAKPSAVRQDATDHTVAMHRLQPILANRHKIENGEHPRRRTHHRRPKKRRQAPPVR
ncbi:hypothetical protein ABZ192_28200 [Streptomyces sp. NPDC006235]|uniref:hypothetical protein n=1 Tax=Streptomyces sp. NPDC006235 TaxID=3156736 RepID=UPI0033B1C89D